VERSVADTMDDSIIDGRQRCTTGTLQLVCVVEVVSDCRAAGHWPDGPGRKESCESICSSKLPAVKSLGWVCGLQSHGIRRGEWRERIMFLHARTE
jgi:hypothetical protein